MTRHPRAKGVGSASGRGFVPAQFRSRRRRRRRKPREARARACDAAHGEDCLSTGRTPARAREPPAYWSSIEPGSENSGTMGEASRPDTSLCETMT